jgi:hypothetical protein
MIGGTGVQMSTGTTVLVIAQPKGILMANLLKSGDASVKPKPQ